MNDRDGRADAGDFSLVLGGPLYQLFLKTRLARAPLDLLNRRVAVLTALAWLPLLVLSALEGHALGGAGIPFLEDVEAQVRLLLALPLLILAERIVHERFRPAINLLVEGEIVRPEESSRFDGFLSSTLRWRNSVAVEILLLGLVFTVGHAFWVRKLAVHGGVWFSSPADSGTGLSRAGLWYAWVSLPLVQFLLLRWWYRLLLWSRLLWLTSRLDLSLSPTHPDRAAGLGLLGTSTAAFSPLLAAQSALVSAVAAGRILHGGAHLADFKVEIAGMLGFALLQALGPLLVFGVPLARARRLGLHDYGLLGDRYVREFDRKWIRGGAEPGETLVGTSDIQSLADLHGSFDIIRSMHAFPFGKETVIQLVATTALPLLPLLLTVMPLNELVKKVVGAIF
jgi:hypothetical protein